MEDYLNCLEGKRQLSPPPDLFERVQAQINENKVRVIPARYQWLAVAAALLLLILNAWVLLHYSDRPTPESGISDQLQIISDYQIYEE